jgi:arylsulfatase A-like enzyme
LVPWIAWGSGIKAGHVIQQPVSIIDTGATVMRTLGVETYTEWESHSVEEIFATTPTKQAASAPSGKPSGMPIKKNLKQAE